nr:unnamed protein product [Spirometra erinaceieuropaei]
MFRTPFAISAPLRQILRLSLPGRATRSLSICLARHVISLPRGSPQTSFTRTVSTVGNGVISSDSEYSSGDSNSTFESEDLEILCEKALDAAVKFVPHYGWTREALEAGCSAENLPPGLHSIAMPRGGIDLVTHFYESQNHLLAEELARWRAEESDSATSSSQPLAPNSFGFKAPPPFATKAETDAFLSRAIQYRLRAIETVLPYWPQAMGLLSLPQNVPAAIALEAQLVDEIWAQAGDRSVDELSVTALYPVPLPHWRRRIGGQFKTWLDTVRQDTDVILGPSVFGLRRWRREWVGLSRSAAADRHAWRGTVRDIIEAD